MRAGGCTLQQALTPEATAVVMQAVSLARRRGHAQVTPLHVASTMLSSTTGLLRAACLQSHSHPLQCKALELCFNVALNRLPASTSSTPMLTPHHHHPPSLSNALIAAFKRAQAHQRRGSIESQQQPLLAVKIEIEQLVISILDDPSVSRVMREAGFSSTQVKSNVEQAVSLEMCSPSSVGNPNKPKQEGAPLAPLSAPAKPKVLDKVRGEDVMSVMDYLTDKRRRNVVVVGECLNSIEGVVRRVMDKVDKGEAPEPLRGVQFINLPILSFAHRSKEEVEHKVSELRCLVESCCMGRGAVLYLGDLRWAAEYRASCWEKGRNYYCPVEHVIMEIGRLAGRIGGGESTGGRFWIMGIASYQTYMTCRIGHPSLENLWDLHPLTVPAGSLDLSLRCDSDLQNSLTCYGKDDGGDDGSLASNLPSWLQQYKDDRRVAATNDQGALQTRNLCMKWNSLFCSAYKLPNSLPEKTLSFPMVTTASVSSYEQPYANVRQTQHGWPLWKEHHFFISNALDETHDLNTSPVKSKLASVSTSSSDTTEMEYHCKFKELNAENLKTICNALEKKVPWQMDMIPDIASTILQCRSGMTRRKDKSITPSKAKEDTWLFFQGCDVKGKENISRELAALVFRSSSNIAAIGLINFAETRADSTDTDSRNKRARSETSHSYIDRFVEAVRDNPHRVFLLEDIEQVDPYSQIWIRGAIERGTVRSSDGEEVPMEDAIVILSCETFEARSRACSPTVKQRVEVEEEKAEETSCASLDLNLSAEEEEDGLSHGLVEAVDRMFFFNVRDDLL